MRTDKTSQSTSNGYMSVEFNLKYFSKTSFQWWNNRRKKLGRNLENIFQLFIFQSNAYNYWDFWDKFCKKFYFSVFQGDVPIRNSPQNRNICQYKIRVLSEIFLGNLNYCIATPFSKRTPELRSGY